MKITQIRSFSVQDEDGRGYMIVRVDTDAGHHGLGEVGIRNWGRAINEAIEHLSEFVIGADPWSTEKLWQEMFRSGFFPADKVYTCAISAIDIALWDLAGKYYDAPVYELLGGSSRKLPCYASTYLGDGEKGGLDSPEAYADFAEQCFEMGYPAFKIHGWGDYKIQQEIDMIHAVRAAVGPEMDLMLDPACEINTWLEAVKIGKACDEANYMWLEDPYKDTGVSMHGHKKLREIIKTPLLQTEHIRGVEQHVDFIASGATDIVRVDPDYDSGFTGAMKIAHAAEGFGLDVEIHSPGPAQRHLMAALRNTNYYEMALIHPKTEQIGRPHEVYADGYRDAMDSIDSEGYVPVPQGDGLGVTYDWDFIMKNRQGGREYGG